MKENTEANEVIRALAEFAVKKEVMEEKSLYKNAILNWFGCAISGAKFEAVQILSDTYKSIATGGIYHPINSLDGFAIDQCVALDCMSGAARAYDDILFRTTLHPTGSVLAAIFGVARQKKISGQEALVAFQKGLEIECRMAEIIFGQNTKTLSGWYTTGIVGGIGAAAAVGNLYDFNVAQMIESFALAASMASGLRGTHGSMATLMPPATAARTGYMAAQMVRNGFTCDIAALTEENGMFGLIAKEPDIMQGIKGIGTEYLGEQTSFKLYPYGFITFAAIQCARELAEKYREHSVDVERIEITASPFALSNGSNKNPKTLHEGAISVYYAVAIALSNPESVFYPVEEKIEIKKEIREIIDKSELLADLSMKNEQAAICIYLRNGEIIEARCDKALGTGGHKMTQEEIDKKYRLLTEQELSPEKSAELYRMIQQFETLEDISSLICIVNEACKAR